MLTVTGDYRVGDTVITKVKPVFQATSPNDIGLIRVEAECTCIENKDGLRSLQVNKYKKYTSTPFGSSVEEMDEYPPCR